MSDALLQIKNLYKKFRGVQALDDVSLDIEKGEVHSIIGENGAGKSTLIKIISGVVRADEGQVILRGESILNLPAAKIFARGISASYQENSLFDNLTIAQNLFISSLYRYKGFNFSWEKAISGARKILDYFGINNVDPLETVSELPPETRQIIEILKTVSRKADILCLDEPTASLTESGAESLFKLLNDLKSKGITIIYVSHNLDEVLKISDRITVLRDGKKVETIEKKSADKSILHQLMIGREIMQRQRQKAPYTGEKPVLKVLNAGDGGKLHDISFELYKGEVLGLAGLVGSGRTELAWLLFGLSPLKSGNIYYNGAVMPGLSPATAIKKGIMYLPEERKLMGLFLGQDLKVNITSSKLDKIRRGIMINFRKERILTEEVLKSLGIKYATLNQLALKLSGGNQQKLLFGKCLFTDPELLILDEPTKGIDVGSKEEIYELIEKLVDEGMTIILISSEVEEICKLSDRVLIMVKGKIKDVYKGDKINEKDITSCYLQTEKRK
ncbi:MAG: sugar ABC transporter ATP-binding protein [Actinobacteria bacterium]|nr:sugar ABC transporter ATP-binding protein [Actinomycetota bacterium]